MDFSKIKTEVEALLKAEPAAITGTPMTAEQFAVYAGEQVTKAQAEAAAGQTDVAKSRVQALAVEVDKITKFEFKPGEIPAVTIFKDPAQLSPAEISAPAGEQTPGGQNWIAKSAEFGALLSSAVKVLEPTPAAAASDATNGTEESWPRDMAASKPAEEFNF